MGLRERLDRLLLKAYGIDELTIEEQLEALESRIALRKRLREEAERRHLEIASEVSSWEEDSER